MEPGTAPLHNATLQGPNLASSDASVATISVTSELVPVTAPDESLVGGVLPAAPEQGTEPIVVATVKDVLDNGETQKDIPITEVQVIKAVTEETGAAENVVLAAQEEDSSQVIARALWEYTAIEDNELSFKAGDIIEIIELCNDDWYEGRLGGIAGYFPANRVEVLKNGDLESQVEVKGEIPQIPDSAAHPKTPTSATDANKPRFSQILGGEIVPDLHTATHPDEPESENPFADEKDDESYVEADAEINEEEDIPDNISATNAVVADSASEISFGNDPSEPLVGEAADKKGDTVKGFEEIPDSQYVQLNGDAPEAQPEEGYLEPPWRWAKDDEGQIYYWNEETGERSWDPPAGYKQDGHGEVIIDTSFHRGHEKELSTDSNARSFTHTITGGGASEIEEAPTPTISLAGMDLSLSLVDMIPNDLIRREGPVRRKLKREDDGREPRITATWKSLYAVSCVGFIIFFREAPSKSRKSLPPVDIIPLSNVILEIVGKDTTSKKNAFMMTLESGIGRQWLIAPDSDPNQWIETLKASSRDRITPVEYENAVARLFSKSKSETDLLSIPIIGSKVRRSTSAGKEKDTIQIVSDQERSKSQVRSKLTAFFSKKTSNSKTKDKGPSIPEAEIQGSVFGGDLLSDDGRNIPEVVEVCCLEVERRGLLSQGIYRLSGNTTTIQKLRASFNQMETVRLDSEDIDINVVASLLKLYFRELQNPLIPFEFYESFIKAAKIDSYDDRLITFKNLIQSLPHSNYHVLEHLMRHLCKVAANSEVNKMERSNLAIVFAPTLIRNPEEGGQVGYNTMANMPHHNTIIEAMLEQFEWLFDGRTD
ncbi:Rho GTPase-activating protein 15 [Dinochytrium kinnereticum]|nr:Rho GTPase-activating protein 15 [Dinochytrium kinnereticum]